jgi:HEPN domain-containing protein
MQVVGEWTAKAENDLKTATHTLTLGEECPTDTVCFHAQQCIEKSIKAYLASKNIDFPKTHDLGRLILLMPKSDRPKLTVTEQRRFTAYATEARYPGYFRGDPSGSAGAAILHNRRAPVFYGPLHTPAQPGVPG